MDRKSLTFIEMPDFISKIEYEFTHKLIRKYMMYVNGAYNLVNVNLWLFKL